MFGSQAQRTEDMWQKAATSLVSSVTELSYSSIFRHFQFFSIIDKAKSVVSPQEVPRASLKYTAHSNQSHTFGNSQVKVAQSFLTLRPHELYSPWNSPGQNTGVSSLFLLQGIFSTQESNPGLPHCRQIRCQLSHKRSCWELPRWLPNRCFYLTWVIGTSSHLDPGRWHHRYEFPHFLWWRSQGCSCQL